MNKSYKPNTTLDILDEEHAFGALSGPDNKIILK